MGVGRKWTLLASIAEDLALDGYVALRTRDIARVGAPVGGDVSTRVLAARQQWPPSAPKSVPLDRTGALLRRFADVAPLLSLYTETDDPDECFVGKPVRWADTEVCLREISPAARWEDTVSVWRYREITRVEVGDGYAAALAEVGGEPPPYAPDAER
ncbi:hypothetical protein EFY87_06620 [Flexivirga caeni]|uniref:Uncharacterized protein n=1 Tax=Flexivirga caeni TaxID=2294115 RepID=A0A3M9MGB6_9MICO|nr:hypothetical protein EFY87_06620 [Flexivirga caeni]